MGTACSCARDSSAEAPEVKAPVPVLKPASSVTLESSDSTDSLDSGNHQRVEQFVQNYRCEQ
jgi:hypothetical protein